MDINDIQRKIQVIASKISEVDNDEGICALLLDLRPIIEGEHTASTRLAILCEIWKHQLPQQITCFLKEKQSYMSNSWLYACHLSSLAVDCCIGYSSDMEYMDREFIPDLTSSILQTLSKMSKTFSEIEKCLQRNLCGNISWIVMILGKLTENFLSTSIVLLASKDFMQFLMIEDPSISLLALSLLKNIFKNNTNIFYQLCESRAHSIVEELTFKLFGTADNSVAKVSLSVLLLLLEMHPLLLELFSTKRYRGFRTYITKLHGKGFDGEIQKLLAMLETQSKRLQASQKEQNAAIVIQSCYKGYKLRRKLQMASIAITKFQRIYRAKKEQHYEQRTRENLEKMKTHFIETDRRKTFVSSKIKQLKTIEAIPAKTVDKFLENLEHESASKIQAAWKGYRIRNILEQLKPELKKEKAAIIIQKHIRKWLERCRSKHISSLISMLPPGLDDQRKVELQTVIGNIRNRFPVSCKSDRELHELHDASFRKLNNHMIGLQHMRRQDERRKVLLAQLSVLSGHLSRAPHLDHVNSCDVEEYASHSTPIVMAARQQHLECLNEHKLTWWKKLEIENIDNARGTASFHLNDEKQF